MLSLYQHVLGCEVNYSRGLESRRGRVLGAYVRERTPEVERDRGGRDPQIVFLVMDTTDWVLAELPATAVTVGSIQIPRVDHLPGYVKG